MQNHAARVLASFGIISLLTACGHASQMVPKSSQVITSTQIRHVRDTVGLQVIGHVTSRSAFGTIYTAPGLNPDGGTEVIDYGAGHVGKCSNPDLDTCAVGDCDPNDGDCVAQYDVAKVDPTPNASCFGSRGALGNNIPFGTSDKAHAIVDVYALGQSAMANGFSRVGWVYIMGNYQDAYTQDSGDNPSYFQNALMNIPALAIVVQTAAGASKGAYIHMTFDQAQTLIKDYKSRRGASAGSCFTRPLYT